MAKYAKPKLLFKYKPLGKKVDFQRIEDILIHNRLYCCQSTKLNDPFEAARIKVWKSHAGISMEQNSGLEPKWMEELRNKVRILSLSEDCFSQVLWANYANEYRGVCVGFYRKGAFQSAKSVNYSPVHHKELYYAQMPKGGIESKVLKEIMSEAFNKSSEWRGECEWRVVENKQAEYMKFDESQFACLIIGNKVGRVYKRRIKDLVGDRFPILEIFPFKSEGRLVLDAKKYIVDGSERGIKDVDALIKYLRRWNLD